MSEKTPSKVVGKDPKYRESSSKRTISECRFCDKSMKEQNYATHLKFIHSKEDWKDLRDKSNKSIQDMFAKQTSTIKRPAPPQDTNVDISENFSGDDSLDINQNKPDDTSDGVQVNLSGLDVSNDVAADDSNKKDEENNKLDQADSITALNQLLTKMAPLAKLEDDTISKLVDNIESIAKLTISSKEPQSEKKPAASTSTIFLIKK